MIKTIRAGYSRLWPLLPASSVLTDRAACRRWLWQPMLLLLTLTGCNSASIIPGPPGEPDIAVSADNNPPPAPAPEDYPVAPFTGDTLYRLLLAEIAGYRTHYNLALRQYVAVAAATRDPGVAARATFLALRMKQQQAALDTALIWAEVTPDSEEAHRYAMELLLGAGRFEEAIAHLEALVDLGGFTRYDELGNLSRRLNLEQRMFLLQAIAGMLARHPDDVQLMFSKATLLQLVGEFEQSLVLVEQLLETVTLAGAAPLQVNAILLKVNALASMNRHDDARVFLEGEVSARPLGGLAENSAEKPLNKPPGNTRLHLALARLLIDQDDLDAARVQYEAILSFSPNDGEVLFALALLALEQKDDAAARRYLELMVRLGQRTGQAHFYLGDIAERQSDTATALREYLQVEAGVEFLPAQSRIATLLAATDRWHEARQYLAQVRREHPGLLAGLTVIEARLLTERGTEQEVLQFLDDILIAVPDNVDLLYFRAMTGYQFGHLDILERDLKQVIALDPDHADALNALGYTLTDQTDRHEEALRLIQRALELRPGEAAFIDSLGWVQYRLRNFDEALVHLRQALQLLPNDEVAAHLGEVLWVVGNQREANEVWGKALENAPDSEILKDVMQRFGE